MVTEFNVWRHQDKRDEVVIVVIVAVLFHEAGLCFLREKMTRASTAIASTTTTTATTTTTTTTTKSKSKSKSNPNEQKQSQTNKTHAKTRKIEKLAGQPASQPTWPDFPPPALNI